MDSGKRLARECGMQRESELYAPVKALVEAQGYVVKGEIGAADIVAPSSHSIAVDAGSSCRSPMKSLFWIKSLR